MTARNLYDRARVAEGYAFARPPLHALILERVRPHLDINSGSPALDLGCGAGRSTAALSELARFVVGIDPAIGMLAHRARVAPAACFVSGEAERLPFPDAAFSLLTAAGSINYADLDLALPEAARVLISGGTFVVYDFSAGRRFQDNSALAIWYDEFERRYPDLPGYALDIRTLPLGRFGLALATYEEFTVRIPMTWASYLAYAMSETRTEVAIAGGVPESDIREWCSQTLEPLFMTGARSVEFDAYAACLRHSLP